MSKHGWIYKKLGDVANVAAGQGAPQGDANYSEIGIPFVKAGNLEELVKGKSITSIQKVTEEVASSHRLKRYEAGSVLFAKSGMSCMKGWVYTLPMDCYVVSHLAIVTAKNVNPHFLNYYLRVNKPNTLVKDSAYPSISLKDIENMHIPVPPKAEQESIVAELDEVNEAITALLHQVSDLDTLARSTFYTMFGDPETNPKGWDVKKIGDICTLKSGDSSANNSKEGNLPYVKVADMNLAENADYILTSSKFVDREQNQRGVFPIGTIIFPKRGGAILTNKKRMTRVEVCCDLNVMGVIPSEVIDNIYLYQWFKIFDLSKVTSGSTVLQLNNCDIAPLKISLPPLALQQEFAAKVEAIESAKAEINAQIAEMQTLLASRMDYYFD